MKLLIPIAASICIFFTSCYHVYYSPNTANTPLLTEKKETRINGILALGGSSDFRGGEFQFAHALTNHFGFMVNGLAAGLSENTGDYAETGNGHYLEVAPGFFLPLSSNKKWTGEIYGGVGTGRVKNEYGLGDLSRIGITKYFLQPAIGYKVKNFEVAFSPKISFVNWKVKEERFANSESDKLQIERIKSNPHFTAFEPAIIFRAGGEDLKVQFGLSMCKNGQLMDLTETGVLSLGFSVNIKNGKK